MAIVMVLSIMALLMVLVLALLSMGSSETRASAAFSQSSQVRGLSEMPVSIIMGQIREATSGLGMTKSWASQPGMIRVFGTESGGPGGRARLDTAWRLYSSDKMSESGTTFNATTEADTLSKWKETRAQFTDLNEPVAQINAEGGIRRVYPILDASALQDPAGGGKTGKVAGFGIAETATVPDGTPEQPLPMPVRWLYVLQDGRLVVPTGGSGNKATFDESIVSKTNPIVGRIAFWTDDESCKVNLNTAGEGTPWDVPRAAGWSDRNFAYYIPAQNEFQRFPGHPAMTCLSTVFQAFDDRYKPLTPFVQNDGSVANKAAYQAYLKSIYDLIPRTNPGLVGEGTRGGTETPTSPEGLPMKRERLFASVDEFFYGSGFDPGSAQRAVNPSGGAVDAADLEMSRFFLTAHSRAPEVNAFNRPRISLWPMQAETNKRTAKDKLLAFCATAAGQTACFQRASTWENDSGKQGSSQSPTADFALSQNQKVFGYLQTLTKKGVPGFGTAT
ncbi:MAG: Verru_Chthon cassette protein A, partial [Roseimicrobium sp.]